MKRIPVIHLARVLRVLVLAVLVMNILCLLLVPGIVAYVSDGGPAALAQAAQAELQAWLNAWQGREAETHFPMLAVFLGAWPAVWTRLDTALLTLFYWLCGGCTAVILWQAKGVLDTILTQTPFLRANAGALKRAAVCCWVISGAALVRLWCGWCCGCGARETCGLCLPIPRCSSRPFSWAACCSWSCPPCSGRRRS